MAVAKQEASALRQRLKANALNEEERVTQLQVSEWAGGRREERMGRALNEEEKVTQLQEREGGEEGEGF